MKYIFNVNINYNINIDFQQIIKGYNCQYTMLTLTLTLNKSLKVMIVSIQYDNMTAQYTLHNTHYTIHTK